MEKFNLERALAGEPVITRDGREVTRLTHFKEARGQYNLAGLIDGVIWGWHENGISMVEFETNNDLFMKPKENAVWVNIYKRSDGGLIVGYYYDSEAKAKEESLANNYIKTVKITE